MGTQSVLIRAPARGAKETSRAAARPRASATTASLTPDSFAAIPVFAPGERAPISSAFPRITLQRKLAIGAVDDPLEREADRVAEHVMRTPDPTVVPTRSSAPLLRRKCACEGTGKSCAACSAEQDDVLKRKATAAVTPTEAPPIVHEVLRSPGQPLDASTRAFFEPRFGHDFASVRVHADAKAAASARAVNALAYTVGRDVVFGAGGFAADTPAGRRLLSHELTHVVQQAGATVRRQVAKEQPAKQRSPAYNWAPGPTQAATAVTTYGVTPLPGSLDNGPSWKERIAAWVTSGAEAAHDVYELFAAYSAEHPLQLWLVNVQIDLASEAVGASIDTNPDTLGWLDLGTMWLFELGANPIHFGENARTTKEMQGQEGVKQVRELALAELKKGELTPIKRPWTYGQKAFYDGLKQRNLATSFLGSYDTKAFLKAGPRDSAVIELEVNNVSSWESATRLRKAATKGGVHQGIIPSRNRGGDGLHLGGNMTQYWNWSETLKT